MAYADSWGVTPTLMKSVPDVSTRWMIPSAAVLYGWEEDPSFDVICRDDGGDGTVYFESDPLLQPSLAGTVHLSSINTPMLHVTRSTYLHRLLCAEVLHRLPGQHGQLRRRPVLLLLW